MSPLRRRGAGLKQPSRAEFSITDFTQLVDQYGYDVTWSKYAKCPNDRPDKPGHHRPNCTLCDSKGRLFYDTKSTRMIGSSLGLNSKVAPEALYKLGTIYLTTYPGDRPSFRDKVVLMFSELRYSERFTIGNGLTYVCRYTPLNLTFAMNNNGDPIDTTVITVSGRSITFPALPAGTAFVTVAYDHHPVYMVQDVMHIIRDSRTTELGQDTPTEFNRQVVAQLEFTTDTSDPNAPGGQ